MLGLKIYDIWSLKTCLWRHVHSSFTLKSGTFCQKFQTVVLQDRQSLKAGSLSRQVVSQDRWSLKMGVSQDRFHCISGQLNIMTCLVSVCVLFFWGGGRQNPSIGPLMSSLIYIFLIGSVIHVQLCCYLFSRLLVCLHRFTVFRKYRLVLVLSCLNEMEIQCRFSSSKLVI